MQLHEMWTPKKKLPILHAHLGVKQSTEHNATSASEPQRQESEEKVVWNRNPAFLWWPRIIPGGVTLCSQLPDGIRCKARGVKITLHTTIPPTRRPKICDIFEQSCAAQSEESAADTDRLFGDSSDDENIEKIVCSSTHNVKASVHC